MEFPFNEIDSFVKLKIKKKTLDEVFTHMDNIQTSQINPAFKIVRKKELKPVRTIDVKPELMDLLGRMVFLLGVSSTKIDNLYEEEIPKIVSTMEDLLKKLEKIEEKIEKIEEKLREQEAVIIVKEIPFDEAKKMAEEYIMSKKEGDYVDPLELAETLQIPYEQAHEIFLQLIEEGKLKLEG